jgi:hypothetical protein
MMNRCKSFCLDALKDAVTYSRMLFQTSLTISFLLVSLVD